jgi:hypothetical protein
MVALLVAERPGLQRPGRNDPREWLRRCRECADQARRRITASPCVASRIADPGLHHGFPGSDFSSWSIAESTAKSLPTAQELELAAALARTGQVVPRR